MVAHPGAVVTQTIKKLPALDGRQERQILIGTQTDPNWQRHLRPLAAEVQTLVRARRQAPLTRGTLRGSLSRGERGPDRLSPRERPGRSPGEGVLSYGY